MTWRMLDMFYPNGWTVCNEKGTLIYNPYGDSYDILLQNAKSEVLQSYPILIPTGDLNFNDTEIARLINYVKKGGVLVLNTAYLNQFPSDFIGIRNIFELITIKEIGDGNLIIYGPDFWLDWVFIDILNKLSEIFLPFKIEGGKVEFLINRTPNSWIITIINNEGVLKTPYNPPKIDKSKEKTISITFTGDGKITEIKDLLDDSYITKESKKEINIDIEAGDIEIIEFILE